MDYIIFVYILIAACFILGIYAQIKVQSSFSSFSSIEPENPSTTELATQKLLSQAGLTNIEIKQIKGNLTDNYNPKNKTISLSDSTRADYSVSGIGVIAHEIGHAVQDKVGYLPFKIRQMIVPFVNIGTFAFYPVFIIGLLVLALSPITSIGRILIIISCALYFLSTLFYLVTWPVERDASNRALALLLESQVLNEDEALMAKKVLRAAELTYIATLLTSFAYFLRFFLYVLPIISGGKRK